MDWSLYEKRMNINGATDRDEIINNHKDMIVNKIIKSPSLKRVLVKDAEMSLVIHSTKKANEKTFNTLPGGLLNIGDSIVWNKMHWLVTEIDFDDEITRGGTIIQCNREIKWQNPITLEIISRWCFAERPYANGIKDGDVISVPDRQFRIKLPYDGETALVDIDRRFILDTIAGVPRTYKLLMPDLVTSRFVDSEGGFVVWNLEFDSNASEPKDNLALGICNYIPPNSPTPPIEPDPTLFRCETIGSSVLKCGGSARSYRAAFYQANGTTPDETVSAVWAVDVSPKYADKIISVPNGNSIELSCVDDMSMVGIYFTLKLTDYNGLCKPITKEIEVISSIG